MITACVCLGKGRRTSNQYNKPTTQRLSSSWGFLCSVINESVNAWSCNEKIGMKLFPFTKMNSRGRQDQCVLESFRETLIQF